MSEELKTPTCDEARDILIRFNNSHFQEGECARYSIPARPERDDDIQLARFIDRTRKLEAENGRLWKALEKIEKEPPSEMAFSLMRGIARIEIGRRRRQN